MRAREQILITDFSGLSGKIGLLGGTFDPIHNAHLKLAQIAQETHNLDSVVFIPAGHNPLKERVPTSSEHRLKMVVSAIEDTPNFYTSRIEIDRPERSFTVDTLSAITDQLRGKGKLFWIIGSDCLHELHRWREIDRIFFLADIITVQRKRSDKEEIDSLQLTPQQRGEINRLYIDIDPMLVSSTSLRTNVSQQDVPAAVWKYIQEHRLYK